MLPLIPKTALVKSSLFECPYVNGLIKTIEKQLPLTMESKLALMKCAVLQTLQAQEVLLKAGQINDRFYWIETGLIRFFSDTDTDDITTGFCREGDFFCATSSFFAQKPATESICVEETTRLFSISYADLQRLFGLYPELSDAFHCFYGCFFAQRQADVALLRYGTSLARYEAFLELYPHLAHRILVKHIASFLNLHRVTLCKIRKDLAKKT